MDLQMIFTFAMAVFALAVKPGPGMTMVVSRTISSGLSSCFMFIAAVCIVSLFYLGLVLAGLKFAAEDLVFISILLKTMAAVYLIYLGIKGLMNPTTELQIREYKERKLFDEFVGFLLMTLSNPLVIVFYGGLVPSILDISTITMADAAILGLTMIVVEAFVALMYCVPVAYSRHFITPELLRRISIGSSVVLILVGLYIGYTALPAQDVVSVVE